MKYLRFLAIAAPLLLTVLLCMSTANMYPGQSLLAVGYILVFSLLSVTLVQRIYRVFPALAPRAVWAFLSAELLFSVLLIVQLVRYERAGLIFWGGFLTLSAHLAFVITRRAEVQGGRQ